MRISIILISITVILSRVDAQIAQLINQDTSNYPCNKTWNVSYPTLWTLYRIQTDGSIDFDKSLVKKTEIESSYFLFPHSIVNTKLINPSKTSLELLVFPDSVTSFRRLKNKNRWHKKEVSIPNSMTASLLNPTLDTIEITQQDGKFILIQEALNQNGDWEPFECWSFSGCGNSYREIYLYPGYYFTIALPKYQGKFKTKIRLKLAKKTNPIEFIYSEPFDGSINLKDLKQNSPNLRKNWNTESYLDLKPDNKKGNN